MRRPSIGLRRGVWIAAAVAGLTLLVGQVMIVLAVKGQDESLARIEKALARANADLDALNRRLDHLASIDHRMAAMAEQTISIGRSTGASARLAQSMERRTGALGGELERVNASTGRIEGLLGELAGRAGTLSGQIAELGRSVGPLAADTRSVRGSVEAMGGGLDSLNGSLRYVIRVLNYLTAPPGGGGFSVRVDLDEAALPDIPGLRAEVGPVQVFPRGAWEVYAGP